MSPDIGTNIDKFLRCILNIENWTTWLLSDPLVSKGSTQKTEGIWSEDHKQIAFLGTCSLEGGGGRGGNSGLLAS